MFPRVNHVRYIQDYRLELGFADGTRGVLGDPEGFGSDHPSPDVAPLTESITNHEHDIVRALSDSQFYTDSQLASVQENMKKLEDSLLQAHEEKLRGFENKLEEKAYDEIRHKVSWHVGFIAVGGIIAAFMSVVLLGAPLVVAGATAIATAMPAIGQELNDLKHRWG